MFLGWKLGNVDAVDASQAVCPAGGHVNATGGGQTGLGPRRDPGLVLHHRKLFVHFVHSHQFLFTTSPVRPSRDVVEIDWLSILVESSHLTVARIVSETVLNADNDPGFLGSG